MSSFSSNGRLRRMDLTALDALRGLAALYVMLSHARWFLWVPLKEYVASSQHGVGFVIASLSGLLAYSHQAVLLFFLLSGFCIHYRQAKMLAAGGGRNGESLLNVGSFAWRRFRRLYPPLLVALVLTAVCDFVVLRINPSFFSGATGYPGIDNLPPPDFSIGVLVGNLLMQGGLSVPAFGNDVPLWSLAWESWFYVLYPVALLLSVRWMTRGMVAVVGVISLVSFIIPQNQFALSWLLPVLTYWIVWVAGAVIAEAYAGRIQLPGLRWAAPLAGIVAVGVVVRLALRHLSYLGGADVTFEDVGSDIVLSLALAPLLAYLMLEVPDVVRIPVEAVARRLKFLGDMSYSLYVVHYPLIALISAWWLSQHVHLPLGAELAIAGAVASLALGWLCWYLVERHCVASRKGDRVPARVAMPQVAASTWSTAIPRTDYAE